MDWTHQILNVAKQSSKPEVRAKAQERREAIRLYQVWLEKRQQERRSA